MLNKSRLAITTLAITCLTGALANITIDKSQNCTGYFYEDISAAFVECFDEEGVLKTKQEYFFKNPMAKECNSTTFSELQELVNGTLMADLNETATLELCHFYEVSVGYQFSQVDDEEIGMIAIPSQVGSERDLFYKNESVSELHWEWDALKGLIDDYAEVQCRGGASGSGNVTNSTEVPTVQDVWYKLSIEWE